MVVRHVDQILWSQTQANDDFFENHTNRVTSPYFALTSEFKKRVFSGDEIDFGPSKKFSVTSHDMKFDFASFLMIISIFQSKRGGHTTLTKYSWS